MVLHHHSNEAEARFVAQLAGRFGRPELRHVAEYRAGDLNRSGAAFVLPAPVLPPELIADSRRARVPVTWFAEGQGAQFESIDYRGMRFAASGGPAPLLAIAPGADGRVLANGRTTGGLEAPWALSSGNLAYFAELPWRSGDTSDRHLIFADLLFEIFSPAMPPRRRALIRVDDLAPETSPRRLRSIADLLSAADVPFELSVRGGREVLDLMRARPQLSVALGYARARGGVLVLRDPAQSLPAGMPPAPFETVDGDGALVIPDNLRSAGEASRHLVVRDSLLSYSHHWSAGPEALQSVLAELRLLGYRFVGPREAVQAAPGHAELPLHRASAVSMAAAGWLAALPRIDLPLLIALLALVTSMWLWGEMLLSRFGPESGPRSKHGSRKLKSQSRKRQVPLLTRSSAAASA